jgi:hypothetical protein
MTLRISLSGVWQTNDCSRGVAAAAMTGEQRVRRLKSSKLKVELDPGDSWSSGIGLLPVPPLFPSVIPTGATRFFLPRRIMARRVAERRDPSAAACSPCPLPSHSVISSGVREARNLSASSCLGPLPIPFREETVGEEGTPSPGCFCEGYQNKGFAGASVRNGVKTRDLEI